MPEKHFYGCKLSPRKASFVYADHEHIRCVEKTLPLPAEIQNQEQTPHCTGFAAANAASIRSAQCGCPGNLYDGHYIFNHEDVKEDVGGALHSLIRGAKLKDSKKVCKICKSGRETTSLNDIKTAIGKGIPVMIGIPLSLIHI